MSTLLYTSSLIALGFFFGWQCRDHAQLEKEWRDRDTAMKTGNETGNETPTSDAISQ